MLSGGGAKKPGPCSFSGEQKESRFGLWIVAQQAAEAAHENALSPLWSSCGFAADKRIGGERQTLK
jgi:hypothetical protein